MALMSFETLFQTTKTQSVVTSKFQQPSIQRITNNQATPLNVEALELLWFLGLEDWSFASASPFAPLSLCCSSSVMSLRWSYPHPFHYLPKASEVPIFEDEHDDEDDSPLPCCTGNSWQKVGRASPLAAAKDGGALPSGTLSASRSFHRSPTAGITWQWLAMAEVQSQKSAVQRLRRLGQFRERGRFPPKSEFKKGFFNFCLQQASLGFNSLH